MKAVTTSIKLLVLGAARHGKDSFAEILNEVYGLTFKSSSQAAAEIFLYDTLKEKYGYNSPEECFEDRMNRRPEWYTAICEYNKDDRARLAKGILEQSDCYVGMRDRDEIEECLRQGLFDLIIWVDASERLALESPDSFNIDKSCADVIIDNNGTYAQFRERTIRFGRILFNTKHEETKKPNLTGGFINHTRQFLDEDNEVYIYDWLALVEGWFKIDGEVLDFENYEIIELDDYGLKLWCGGDWQQPYLVSMKFDGKALHVVDYEPCNYTTGLSTQEIKKILGVSEE